MQEGSCREPTLLLLAFIRLGAGLVEKPFGGNCLLILQFSSTLLAITPTAMSANTDIEVLYMRLASGLAICRSLAIRLETPWLSAHWLNYNEGNVRGISVS